MENSTDKILEFFETQNVKINEKNGIKFIAGFSDVEKELEILYNGAALRILSNYAIIELVGNDTLDFLHRITTNSVKNLQKEEIVQTIFTTEKGRILSVATILNFGSYQFLVIGKSNKERVTGWINKYIISDDIKVNDASYRFNILELSGEESDSFITLLAGSIANEIKPNSFKVINSEGILFFLAKITDFNGRNKYWILAEHENSIMLIDYMKENHGIFNFGLIGEDAYHEYRIKLGIPAAPNEINDQYNPLEAGMLHLVDFKKGCYIGQEVIARLDTYDKFQNYLNGVIFEHPIESDQHFMLLDNEEQEVGIVTSAVQSSEHKSSIGLAYIKKNFNEPGTILTAKNNENVTRVTVQELPFKK